jgi:RimJ/RimL family protein N-acetyltransferase
MELTLPEHLETERLIIRVAKPNDGSLFNKAIIDSHAQLSPWLAWVNPLPSVEQSEASCRKAFARYLLNEDLMVFFIEKQSGGLVGGSGLHSVDWQKKQFEIGYWGNVVYSGQGFMTEGIKALANHALNHLSATRVHLSCDESNTRSWKLAERAGFTHEGTIRNERFDLNGELRNTKVYSIVPSDVGLTSS